MSVALSAGRGLLLPSDLLGTPNSPQLITEADMLVIMPLLCVGQQKETLGLPFPREIWCRCFFVLQHNRAVISAVTYCEHKHM